MPKVSKTCPDSSATLEEKRKHTIIRKEEKLKQMKNAVHRITDLAVKHLKIRRRVTFNDVPSVCWFPKTQTVNVITPQKREGKLKSCLKKKIESIKDK